MYLGSSNDDSPAVGMFRHIRTFKSFLALDFRGNTLFIEEPIKLNLTVK